MPQNKRPTRKTNRTMDPTISAKKPTASAVPRAPSPRGLLPLIQVNSKTRMNAAKSQILKLAPFPCLFVRTYSLE